MIYCNSVIMSAKCTNFRKNNALMEFLSQRADEMNFRTGSLSGNELCFRFLMKCITCLPDMIHIHMVGATTLQMLCLMSLSDVFWTLFFKVTAT